MSGFTLGAKAKILNTLFEGRTYYARQLMIHLKNANPLR